MCKWFISVSMFHVKAVIFQVSQVFLLQFGSVHVQEPYICWIQGQCHFLRSMVN